MKVHIVLKFIDHYSYSILIIGAFFVILGLVTLIIQVVRKKDAIKDVGLLSQVCIAISQIFIVATTFVSLYTFKVSLETYDMQKSVNFEYTEWYGNLTRDADGDFSFTFVGTKDDGVRQLKDFRLEITTIFKDIKSGVTDDSLSEEQPKLIITSDSSITKRDKNDFTICVNQVLRQLRINYDGAKQMGRLTSNKKYELIGFYFQMTYWSLKEKRYHSRLEYMLLKDKYENASGKTSFRLKEMNDES